VTTTPKSVIGDSFAGATLGERYRLDSLIGRGGMASVYRSVDLALGRPVAVKVFAEAAEGIDDAERRKSETALLASVSHRALVRLYDASRDPGTGREYLVMELVDGRDLRETLRLGPLSAADAAGMLADLAEALHVIHERGIVHRDVKPANVLLEPAHLPSRTWNAKLADFGIARLIDDARLTRTGLLVGTPGYLSPEQVSGRPPTPAADVYSLGLLVLEARTGETAFPGTAIEAANGRLASPPSGPPPSTRPSRHPP
jgi:eukaryotic-like serine/threonine-protein kinase